MHTGARGHYTAKAARRRCNNICPLQTGGLDCWQACMRATLVALRPQMIINNIIMVSTSPCKQERTYSRKCSYNYTHSLYTEACFRH